MECPTCRHDNPEENRFCGACGTSLAAHGAEPPDLLVPRLWPHIRQRIRADFREKEHVELEVSEAIARRFAEWLKLFGYFVGIPVSIIVLLLGFLGFKQYSDFSRLLSEAETRAKAAKTQAGTLLEQATVIESEFRGLRSQLTELAAIRDEVETLSSDIRRIEEAVGLEPSAALTPELRRSLKASFASFQEYFKGLGFRPEGGLVDVYVDPQIKSNAYYEGNRRRIVIGEPFATDTDVLYREFGHYALSSLAPVQMTQRTPIIESVESALADYFACSFNDDPVFGEKAAAALKQLGGFDRPHFRNLLNSRKFSEARLVPGQPHDMGEVWGGALWEIRGLLGPRISDPLYLQWWRTVAAAGDPVAALQDVGKLLVQLAEARFDDEDVGRILDVFAERGLQLR